MLRPRWQKVLHDLWDDKQRTLLVVLTIAVGTFAMGTLAATAVMVQDDINASYASINPANMQIRTDGFDDDLVTRIGDLPDVAAAEGRRIVSVRVLVGPDTWRSLDITTIADFEATEINKLTYVSGAWPPDDRQLVIDASYLDDLNAEIGDMVTVRLPNGELKDLQVVAVANDQLPSFGISGNSDVLRGYMTFESLAWLGQPSTYNQLFVRVAGDADDRAHIEAVAAEVKDQLERSGRRVYATRLYKGSEHPQIGIIEAVVGVITVMGVITVGMSAFLIMNTISALLTQHVRHIGVMKAVGARTQQLVLMYLVLLLAFGLLALAISLPLSRQVSYRMVEYLAVNLVFETRGPRMVPLSVGLQVLVAIVMPLIAGALPVLNGTRITIREAISSTGLSETTAADTLVDKLVEQVRGLSRPMMISLRNTFRRKGRLVRTLVTLALGGALFIAVFNTQAGMVAYIDRVTKYFLADVNLTLTYPYPQAEVVEIALGIPGVVAVEGWGQTAAEIVQADGTLGETVYIQAPPAASELVEPIIVTGRWVLPGDENALVVNETFLKEIPGLQVGDTLTLRIRERDTTWVVVGVYQFIGDQSLLPYANYDYLSTLLGEPGRASLYRIVGTQHDLDSQQALVAAVDAAFDAAGVQVTAVSAGGGLVANATEKLNVLTVFLLIMALLAGLVGNIGLAGTLSMSVLERRREIGVMRAIGAKNRVIRQMVIVEGEIIGLLSYVLAVGLSFPMTRLLSTLVSMAVFNVPANFEFSYTGFGLWLVVVVVLAVVASVVPARNAEQLTIREVLAYE